MIIRKKSFLRYDIILLFLQQSDFLEHSLAAEWFQWITRKKTAHNFPFLFQCLMEKIDGFSSYVSFICSLTIETLNKNHYQDFLYQITSDLI